MKKVTKSVIRFSEIPENLQQNEVFNGHKIHSYAEFHIEDSEKDELTKWLISNYPTIKRKKSFLIQIDKEIENQELKSEQIAKEHFRKQRDEGILELNNLKNKMFTEHEIEDLQSKIHKITGDGEVMMLFNEMLGINSGS